MYKRQALVGDHSRGSDDADGDGASNLAEFFAGSDPLDPASVFKVTGVAAAGSDIKVRFSTVTNRAYQLQRRDSLDGSSTWMDIGSAAPGSGGVVALTDFSGASNTARYYRVRLQ